MTDKRHAANALEAPKADDAKRHNPDDSAAEPLSPMQVRIALLESRLALANQSLSQVQKALGCIATRAMIVIIVDEDDYNWPTLFCEKTPELAKEFDAIWGKERNVFCEDTEKLTNMAPLLYWQTPKTDTDTCDFGRPYEVKDRKTARCKWPADRAERMAALRAHIDAGKKVHVPTLGREDYPDDQFPDINTPYLVWHVYLHI